MKVLDIYPIAGLFDELYTPDPAALTLQPLSFSGRTSLLRASSLFWAQHLSEDAVASVVGALTSCTGHLKTLDSWQRSIIDDPATFIRAVQTAKRDLIDPGGGPRRMFAALETLTLLCHLTSEFIYSPHRLTVQEGFLLQEVSAVAMCPRLLNSCSNPYLPFIWRECSQLLDQAEPDLVWLIGRPRFSSLAMAKMVRNSRPGVHVSVVGHSSEYFSLNKITEWITRNRLLFEVIDSIVLDDMVGTQDALYEALSTGKDLSTVPNLVFRDASGSLHQTEYKRVSVSVPAEVRLRPHNSAGTTFCVQPHTIANVRLWPDSQCYWNQCTFCGINKKYQITKAASFGDISGRADVLAELAAKGIDCVWLTDEAIPPDVLGLLAQQLLVRDHRPVWQARSRIDARFSGEVCKILAEAGLRELRLGLESASPRVLKLMNKVSADFSFDLVESIVERCHECGISVHFPVIVGFPTESAEERHDTYTFLAHLKRRFPSLTFNVNILLLDVSSSLFRRYVEYDITDIHWPCPAGDFLGNFVEWEGPGMARSTRRTVDAERDAFMRAQLYPWIPREAKTETYIFYRLAETSRATLVWKDGRRLSPFPVGGGSLDGNTMIQRCPNAVVSSTVRESWRSSRVYSIYDWDTHERLEADGDAVMMLSFLDQSRTVDEVLDHMREHASPRSRETWITQIQHARDRHFVLVVP